ncbi:MAG: branched-chain amino acid ABC transporter permease [Peptococcaceae bacterium]|nr:branched-chain amino acid ABC transporter permease [Peptococcaceae bacterium]
MYELVVSINIGIFILLALSLNIITGYSGQPTLGHAAFFGIGAYTGAVITTKMGLSFWLALPLSGIVAGVIGALLGLVSQRVRNDFLAVTTIGINFVTVAVFQYVPFFGASFGMSVKKPVFMGHDMTNLEFFVLIAVLIVLVCLLCVRIQNSWIGLALGGIRNNEAAAAAMGIDVNRFRVIAFTIGTTIAGVAGSVYAHYMTFIYSSDFAFVTSISILSMVVVGGMGTIRGAVAGAVILGVLPELFRFVSDYRMLIYGGLLTLMMRFQPEGLLGNNSLLWNGISSVLSRAGISPGSRETKEGAADQ